MFTLNCNTKDVETIEILNNKGLRRQRWNLSMSSAWF